MVKSGGPAPASPELQRELTGKAAVELGLRAEFHEDAEGHRSGKTQNRPGWQAVMARLRSPDVAAVIVHTWDRAARNTKHLLQISDDCEAAGVRFISVSDNIDTRTAAGKFQLTIIAGVGEYESNAASERRVSTIDYLRRVRGRHYGTAPFGTERIPQDGDLVLVPSRQVQGNGTDHAALARAYALYGEGRLSLMAVCEQMNGEGWRWRTRGGALIPWQPTALRRVLANHMLYAGYVSVGRAYRGKVNELLKGSHAAILPESLLTPVAAAFAAYQRPLKARRVPLVYPLSGLLYCGACGERLAGSRAGDWRGYLHVGHCVAGQPRSTSARKLDAAARQRVQEAAARVPERLDQRVDAGALEMLNGKRTTASEDMHIAAALANLLKAWTWGHIDEATYLQERAAIIASQKPSEPSAPPSAVVVPGLLAAVGDLQPREFATVLRLLYDRISVRSGELTFTPLAWCAGWA